jgi:SAM-dependent methyltransferase
MGTENITTCPICENEFFESYLQTKDFTVTQEDFQLQACKTCGFIITNPRPTENTIGKYYASDKYISHSGHSKSLFDKIYLFARNITLKWKHELITQYSKSGKVLDYGCGTGNENARKKANLKLQGKVSENLLHIQSSKVDIITLWHVLEHVHTLNETIQNLKNLLSKKGLIVIAVPNMESHDARKYKNTWAGYDVPRHLWHFNQDTMQTLLQRNGLKVVAIHPMKLDSFYVSLLSEQYKNPNQSKPITAIKAFKEGLISNYYARKNKQYSSLIYIARPE